MLSKNAVYLLQKRYCKPGEPPEGVFKRVAEFLSEGDRRFEEKLFDSMLGGIFLPNSPCLFNAGAAKHNGLHACFILPIDDDTTSIFNAVSNMAKIFKSGGGVGINFYPLREKGAKLSGGGTSSGQISFMGLFDYTVETVKQGGVRRGALMGINYYYHPEIFDFIRVKLEGKLQNFNLSIMVTDDFMKAVDTDKKIQLKSPQGYITESVKAKDIFEVAAFAAWCNGDPAFLFFDRINKDNPYYPEVLIEATNPCSEVGLPPYGACALGSINLSKFIWKNDFNFDRFEDVCKLGMRTLSALNKLSYYPLPEIKEMMDKFNPVGLGIMGFADCLIKLGIKYDSKECLDFIDKVGEVYKKSTEEYAKDKEKSYFYKRIIAPTGSLSILADCSSGIEPIYDVTFERRLVVGLIEETRDLYKSEHVRTALQIAPEWHVKVLAQWQKWIDGGVSKTVNLPHDASVDDLKGIYKQAWKLGCKGVTVYRDGCRSDQVLVSNTTNKFSMGKCSDESCTL